MKIGLLGGSFNPAHEGHLAISLIALRRLGLDRVWWLVSPQNPLKRPDELDDYERRFQGACEMARHPRIIVSDFEQRHDLIFTHETISFLRARRPGAHFVWLMGADNLASFHKWRNWRNIAELVPIAVFTRPGSQSSAPFSRAGHFMRAFRLGEEDSRLLATQEPPAWIYLTESLHPASSTKIRSKSTRDRPAKKTTGAENRAKT